MHGGRFDFDDGGTYCGGWEEGKAHGHGVCTGPKGQGEYSGAWHYGFEVSGVYTWPSGNSYDGQWQNGKRHGLGIERRGRWAYRGEWTQGFKGRYGARYSTNSSAKYEGTWANGLQDGYGQETYADGGVYEGQWMRGMRHGYGIRKSAPFGIAAKYRSRSHAHASLSSLRSDQSDENHGREFKRIPDDSRGGFVLRARSELTSGHRSLSERSMAVKRTILQGFRFKKQHSTGEIDKTGMLRSTGSVASYGSDDSNSTGDYQKQRGGGGGRPDDHGDSSGGYGAIEEFIDPNVVETYTGEWKNDKRSGYGVCERSDGLKYEGEWLNNRKNGYGVTTFKDGTKEEGKYKNNCLATSQRKKHLLFVRTSKLRERIDGAVAAAQRAMQIGQQKADVAISRAVTAKERAEQAEVAGLQAREDAELAKLFAQQLSPELCRSDVDALRNLQLEVANHVGLSPNKSKSQAERNAGSVSPSSKPYSTSVDSGIGISSATLPPTSQKQPQLAEFLYNYASGTPPVQATKPPHGVEMPEGFEAGKPAFFTPTSDSSLPNLPPGQPGQQNMFSGRTELNYGDMADTQRGLEPTGRFASGQPQKSQQAHFMTTATQPFVQYHPGFVRPPGTAATFDEHRNVVQESMLAPSNHDVGRKQASSPRHAVDIPPPRHALPPTASSSRGGAPAFARDHSPRLNSRRPTALPTIARTRSEKRGLARQQAGVYDFHEQYEADASQSRETSPSREDSTDLTEEGHEYEDSFTPKHNLRRATLAHSPEDKTAAAAASALDAVEVGGPTTSTVADILEKSPIKLVTRNAGFSSTLCSHGSEPDLLELSRASTERIINREEISRLSSQRRQELLRQREDQEMLRANPMLRAYKCVFGPEVRAWILRWKLPLLMILFNLCLSVFFCQLLTYSRNPETESDPSDKK